MSKLLTAIRGQEIKKVSTPVVQTNRRININIGELEAFADALEAEFPLLRVNEGAADGTVLPDEETRMVPYAVIQGGKGHGGQPSGSATVWYNGKVNLTGVLAAFVWPK